MVKIMLQIAITLYVDDADVELVKGCGLTYTRFQNYCRNDREVWYKCGFLLLNWTDKTNIFDLK